VSDRDDEGVTATMNQTGSGAGRNGHGRGSFDRERQGRSAYLVGVLARALTTQVEELARAAPTTPDGWWFAEPQRDGTPAAGDREESR
jgi:hypothetical protein